MNGEQQENLDRVSARIGRAVIDFCREHRQFYDEELRRYVIGEAGETAPGSDSRVLRDLRQKGRLNYRVLNRRESLYEVLWVEGDEGHAVMPLVPVKPVRPAEEADSVALRKSLGRLRRMLAAESKGA